MYMHMCSVYSRASEQGTLWDQYKFSWIVTCREVILFSEVLNVWNYREVLVPEVVSLVERSNIQYPFLGRSIIGGSTVLHDTVPFMKLWSRYTQSGPAGNSLHSAPSKVGLVQEVRAVLPHQQSSKPSRVTKHLVEGERHKVGGG